MTTITAEVSRNGAGPHPQLFDHRPQSARPTDPLVVLEQTAEYFHLEVADLVSGSRARLITTARSIAMYFCRELAELGWMEIARVFDGRDHSTVMTNVRRVVERMATDELLRQRVEEITAWIKDAK